MGFVPSVMLRLIPAAVEAAGSAAICPRKVVAIVKSEQAALKVFHWATSALEGVDPWRGE